MRTQIFLLAVLPIFLLGSYAAIRASLRESHHSRTEWASPLATKIPIVVEQIHASVSPAQENSVLEAAARAGLSIELTERRFSDEVDLRPFHADGNVFASLYDKLIALIDAPQSASANRDERQVTVRIDDTRSIIFRPEIPPFSSPLSTTLWALTLTGLVVLPILLLSYYLAYRLTRPLIEFAADAERISGDENSQEPFKADGALEVRSLRDSLNVMQARIHRMTERRTMVLRSLGHDLRTPLTRLRMRTERCQEADLRRMMLLDISMLAALIDETMAYLKSISGDPVPSKKVRSDEPIANDHGRLHGCRRARYILGAATPRSFMQTARHNSRHPEFGRQCVALRQAYRTDALSD
jgi:hypothetical protein